VIARDVIDTARHNGVTITWRKRWRNSVGLAFEVRFHEGLRTPVVADAAMLTGPASASR
jgi:3'-phosphoadenosine 5'-phosphosulfate sulfotransferase (PAPS reductase)/FAD synthetase